MSGPLTFMKGGGQAPSRSSSLYHCSHRRTGLHCNYPRKRVSDSKLRKKETNKSAEL